MTAACDPVPAVREADARGRTAELFEDIRHTLGVPFVNLVWRHLATVPGGLEWVWGIVRPLYRGHGLSREAAGIRRRVEAETPAGLPPFVFDAAGVRAEDRDRIGAMIASYDHANSLALVALMAARAALAGGSAPGGVGRSEPEPPAAPVPGPPGGRVVLPPLPGLGDLPDPVEALVRDLDRFGRVGPTPVVASLYRHLAHWPGFLALAWTALRPAQEEGRLAAAVHGAVEDARRAGHDLAGGIAPPAAPVGGDARAAVEAGLVEFTERAIGRMVVMGKCMRMLLPEPAGGDDSTARL